MQHTTPRVVSGNARAGAAAVGARDFDRGTSHAHPDLFGRRRWLIGVAVVTAVILLQMVPQLLSGQPRGHVVMRAAFWGIEMPLLMVVLSLHYQWATRKRINSARTVFASVALSLVVAGICAFVLRLTVRTAPGLGFRADVIPPIPTAVAFGCVYGLLQCGVWALAFIYPYAAEDARLRWLEAERLKLESEQLRSAAELARLRTQLEPHFILNTLNAIAGLVTQDPREARRLLASLGDLLRDAFRDPSEMQTVADEIAWLRRYAEILESRHAGALRFLWEITADAEPVLVPSLLLQPLVENAVKHGALRRGGEGLVTVRAAVAAGRLVCVIEDNGPGVPAGEPRAGAFGLRAVRRRLELKYADATFKLEASSEGTRAVVELPLVATANAGAATIAGVQ